MKLCGAHWIVVGKRSVEKGHYGPGATGETTGRLEHGKILGMKLPPRRFILASYHLIIIIMAFSMDIQGDYARLFYPTARGYAPSWPDPIQSGVFSLEGVQIGDLVYRAYGAIIYTGINVTRPANDPRNSRTLPSDYAPVVLQPDVDYTVNMSRFSSPGISYGLNDATAKFDIRSVPKTEENDCDRLEFSTDATAGAYCCLPFGGSSYECTAIGLKKLQRAALAHGHHWYYQLMRVDAFDMQNGELCLVTGCDKASYWATGVFFSAKPTLASRLVKRIVMPHVDAEAGVVKTGLRIEHCTKATEVDVVTSSGRRDTSVRLQNQDSCIALRGFRIGLHASLYNMGCLPISRRQAFWQALPWPIQPRLKSRPLVGDIVSPYHPCAAVSDLIHNMDKNLRISVVHDNDVLSVLNPDEKILPSDAELARRLTEKFVVAVDSSGSGFLKERQEVTLTRFDKICHAINRLRHPKISSYFLSVHRHTWDGGIISPRSRVMRLADSNEGLAKEPDSKLEGY
ncbi:hypothetical protein BDZ89DRAFT_397779 [Hymenopellis radicata]|nr:hypothetical protein BDZ89DRAFT_397779 [Hymenopellis radicata]